MKKEVYFFLLFNLSFSYVSINHFPNRPVFLHVCSKSLLKILNEKEQLLVVSNFTFPTVLKF